MPRRHVAAQRGDGADARAVGARRSTRSPCADAEPLRVLGRQLGALVRGQELQRRRVLDLGRGPDRAERAEAQVAVARGAARRVAGPRGGGSARRSHARGGSRRGVAVLPAHAAAADLVERQAGVERDRLDELLEGHARGERRRRDAEPRAEVGEDLPLGAVLALVGDRRADALQAPVGVGDRPLLLGVALGREDDRRVLAQPVGEERRVGDDRRRLARAPPPTRARPGSSRIGSTCRR